MKNYIIILFLLAENFVFSQSEGRIRYAFEDFPNFLELTQQYDYVGGLSEGLAIVKLDNKYGFIDSTGTLVIPLEYDECSRYGRGEYIHAKKNGKWGVINPKGETVISFSYDKMKNGGENLFAVEKYNKWGYIDTNEKIIIPFEYERPLHVDVHFFAFSEGLAPVVKNGKMGYINQKNEVIIPFSFQEARSFHEGFAAVKLYEHAYNEHYYGGKWAVINKAGKLVFESECRYIGDFHNGLTKIKVKKEGYIDTSGKIVIPLIYDDVPAIHLNRDTKGNLIRVRKDEKFGFLNYKGELVIPFYSACLKVNDNLIFVKKNNHWIGLDGTGKTIFSNVPELVGTIHYNLITAKSNGKIGFINHKTDTVIPFRYDAVRWQREYRIAVKLDGKWGCIDTLGNVIVPIIYDDVDSYYNELAKVRKDGKWGVVDRLGNLLIPCIYDAIDMGYFTNRSFIPAKKEGKYGIINLKNEIIMPFIYGYLSIYNGLVSVSKDKKQGVIDKTGKVIIPLSDYEQINIERQWIKVQQKNLKWGFFDRNGNELLPFIYDKIGEFPANALHTGSGYTRVTKNERKGFISETGKVYIFGTFEDMEEWDGIVQVIRQGKYGLEDTSGRVILPCMYDFMTFGGNMGIIEQDEKYGLVNKEGKIITPPVYDGMGYISENGISFYIINEDEEDIDNQYKEGFLDRNGQVVIPAIYNELESTYFHEWDDDECFFAKKANKWGLIDLSGKIVIPVNYKSTQQVLHIWLKMMKKEKKK